VSLSGALTVNCGGTLQLVEKRVFATVPRRDESLVEKVVYGRRGVGWRVR
jgi:hypothetical protein